MAAAGHLLDLDPERMVHALGLCGAFAPVPSTKGCNWDDRPVLDQGHGGLAVHERRRGPAGRGGVLGPRSIFEGEKGFFRMAGSDRCAPDQLVAGLGEEFRILDLYFKPYPCCRWIHAALDGVRAILARRGWAAADLGEIRVGVAREVLEDLGDYAPRNLVDAQFSLPYAVAMVLLGLEPGPRWHDPLLLESPGVRALMKKVALEEDPLMESLFSGQAIVGAQVRLAGPGGDQDQARIECAYGDARNPMTDADLEAKFLGLAAETIPPGQARPALDLIRDLQRLDRIGTLTALLQGA